MKSNFVPACSFGCINDSGYFHLHFRPSFPTGNLRKLRLLFGWVVFLWKYSNIVLLQRVIYTHSLPFNRWGMFGVDRTLSKQ